MAVITGGIIIPPPAAGAGNTNPGVRGRIYRVVGVPTDAAIGVTAANGLIAEDLNNNNLYERQAGVWVRIDTL